MANRKEYSRTFENTAASVRAFKKINEIKDTINFNKIPSDLMDAIIFRYFASGSISETADRTRIAKEIIILNGLYGLPKIIPRIYFYGPYPHLMMKTINGSDKLTEKSIGHYIKNWTTNLDNIDRNESKQNWELNQRHKNGYLEKYSDLREFQPIFSELSHLDVKELINLSYDILFRRKEPSKYPRVIQINEDKNPVVLNSIAVLATGRYNYLKKYNQKIRKFNKKITEQRKICRNIIFENKVKYTQDLKDGITNKMLILNALSLYHIMFKMKPTVDDLCYTICSHYSMFDMEIHAIENRLGKDLHILKKIKDGGATIKDLLDVRLISKSKFSDWGDYVNDDDKSDDAIDYLKNVGHYDAALDITRNTTLTNDQRKCIKRFEEINQMKDTMREKVLEALIEIKNEKLIKMNNNIITLDCSFIENDILTDGNIVDEKRWRDIVGGIEKYSS